MTESEWLAALKRIEALRDFANDEECKELATLVERVEKHEGSFFEIGSGNVFEDLGLENPEEELRKSREAMNLEDQ